MSKGKDLMKSKTMWIGAIEVLIGTLGLLETLFASGEYTAASITAVIAGIATIILRKLTKEPIK